MSGNYSHIWMAGEPTKEITIDRISNSGNPVAAERHNGKAIHVPGREPGDRLLVRLEDVGGHYRAVVVDRYETAIPQQQTSQPATPSGSSNGDTPNLLELGEKLCGDEPLTLEQRHSESKLAPREYPGKEKRKTTATRHD